MKIITAAVFSALLVSTPVLGGDHGRAEHIFTQYQARELAFDPAAADLYCDTAVIRNLRTEPDGRQRELELPAPKSKELIRLAMPLAKAKGDYNTYSDVAYSQEGSNVRITANRYSVLKQYSSRISLLVGACDDSDWAILEELSQSQP